MMKVWNLFSTNTQSFQIKVTLNHSFSKRSPHLKKVKRFHEQISRDVDGEQQKLMICKQFLLFLIQRA